MTTACFRARPSRLWSRCSLWHLGRRTGACPSTLTGPSRSFSVRIKEQERIVQYADHGRVLSGHVPCGNAGCRPRAKLSEMIGFEDAQKVSGIGAVEVNEKAVAAGGYSVGLEPEDTQLIVCRHHAVEVDARPRNDALSGAIRSFALSLMLQDVLDH